MPMWSVRLRGPRGKQVVLQIDPDTDFKTFSQLAAKQLGLKAKDTPTFRRGFPPRAVEVDGSALIKTVFEPNDTVVVDTNAGSAASLQIAASSTKAKASARPKRAAAKKAAAKAPRGGVHTLHPPTSAKKKVAPKRKIPGSGHQLGSSLENNPIDAATAGADDDEQEPQHKYRRSRTINLTSKEDVEVSLVNAVSGQSHDRASKFFRAATKNAVEHQYELTLATARLNASLARNFEIEELSTTRRGDGSAAKLRIRFKETPRKWKEETVDLLKTDELQAILKYVLLSGGETGREMLKPFNMAQVSTRVFWNIARLYDGDVAAGLADLVPDEDWSFLDTRTRVLSEKAMEAQENEEQYKLWKQGKVQGGEVSSPKTESKPPAKESRRTAATEKKTDVINVGMSDEEEVKQEAAEPKRAAQILALSAKEATPTTLRSAAARAALARFDRTAQSSAVVSAFLKEETPTAQTTEKHAASDDEETESEEEVEEATTVYCDSCKKARILSPEEATNAELDKDPWTCANLAKTGRSGCDAIDDEVAQIAGTSIAEWLQKAGITTRRQLADACVGSTLHALVDPMDPSAQTLQEKLEKLIDEARLDEVNDWMSEIVGEVEVVQRLEVQKLGTPADLLATPSDLILEALGNAPGRSLESVNSWRRRAQSLVDEYPWLADWCTL
ncbi:hypothetical protein PRIC2_008886 [Phytophthora ramorum]